MEFTVISRGMKKLFRSHNHLLKPQVRSIRTKKMKSFMPENDSPHYGQNSFHVHGRIMPPSMLWKPFMFTVSFTAGAFAACAIWQYENSLRHFGNLFKRKTFWYNDQYNNEIIRGRENLKRWWKSRNDGEKFFIVISLANFIVYLGWRVPSLRYTMQEYFCSNPSNKAVCWPLLLSAFSHYSIVHLLVNMFTLKNFSINAGYNLGKEQLTGLYLAGAAFSSFGSLVIKVLSKTPTSSVGASGAVLTLIGYSAMKHPDAKLSFFGLPMLTFTAETALKIIMLIDVMGIVMRWRYLDHVSHLSGTFMGIFWYYCGNSIWQQRNIVINEWQKFRTMSK